MSVNKRLHRGGLFVCLAWLPALPVGAATGAVHDPHRLASTTDFQETIEARCTICHPRERVDRAMAENEDLDVLLQRMIERGAILSERDRSVLGTFWGSPTEGDMQPIQK